MAITITLQAASDAVMTTTNKPTSAGGTLLDDDDLRKVYGLPNQYVGGDGKVDFVPSPRWDTVYASTIETSMIRQLYKGGVLQTGRAEGFDMFESEENMDLTNTYRGIHRPPTTTAFQLQCTSITHEATDMTSINPMPGVVNATGVSQESGTPGQLNNLVVGLGMRSEIINLQGVLFDEGPISASNPRKQVLMNIARLQYYKTGRSGSMNSWGGKLGGPLNPRSYPCLTIFDSSLNAAYNTSYQITQPSNTNLSYRGVIKDFSFNQQGGRPNLWFWNMAFQVLQNEWGQGHSFVGRGMSDGILRINRIRLLNTSDGEAVSSFPTSAAVVEVRTSDQLRMPLQRSIYSNEKGNTVYEAVENYQAIVISNSNSVPKIDGKWIISEIDYDARTFRLTSTLGGSITDNNGNMVSVYDFAEPAHTRTWTSFTDGGDGYVQAGSGSSLSTETLTVNSINEIVANEYKYSMPD